MDQMRKNKVFWMIVPLTVIVGYMMKLVIAWSKDCGVEGEEDYMLCAT